MASGSSKVFDFASDDILFSHEDYSKQENSNGSHSDSAIGINPTQEFHKNRMATTSVYDAPDHSDAIALTVERSMKKHTDNLMRFLEGVSSRLSQLELYCYNLDKSVGEMRSDLTRHHGESDAKLKFLENQLQEVHRSLQILRDKQELSDTQKELAKLQLAQKESSSSHKSQRTEDRSSSLDTVNTGGSPDSHGQQLAIVPASQPQRPPEPLNQPQAAYYQTQTQTQTQYPQSQVPPPQPQYQQQWAQQVQPPPSMQPGSRPSSPQVYPQYLQTQPPVLEPLPNSLPMKMPYSAIPPPPPGSGQPVTNSYGGPVRPTQPQPPPTPQHLNPGFAGPPGESYAASGQSNSYMMYDNESGRVQHQHPSQAGRFYPPNQQPITGGGMMSRPAQNQQFTRDHHPYSELIDKLVSMGYRSDHVINVIQRLGEAGQTVDFNAVLDSLNGHSHSSGGTYRGWSG